MIPVTFYAKENNPEQIFEVVVHSLEKIEYVKKELTANNFEVSKETVLGDFALKIVTESWPLVNTIIQGEIIIDGKKNPR